MEESLRLYTIIFGDGRKVTRDTEFHGCPIRKGDMVYGLVAAANLDPRVNERAGEFVVDRKRNPHLGFAGGPHRCLGAHLARKEMQIATEEWLAAIPTSGSGRLAAARARRRLDADPAEPAPDVGRHRMKLTADAARCTGHGRCYTSAPDLLTYDDDAYVTVRGEVIDVQAEYATRRERPGELAPSDDRAR